MTTDVPKYVISPNFKRVMRRKPPELQASIMACVQQLGKNPRHLSLQTHKVKGMRGVFKAYVDKGNRITFGAWGLATKGRESPARAG